MKNLFILITYCILSQGCKSFNENQSKYVHFFIRSPNNSCIFFVDGDYVSLRACSPYIFLTNYAGDTVSIDCNGMTFLKRSIPYPTAVLDSFHVANSLKEIKSHQATWVFNAKIVGRKWTVSLYFPYDDIEGTYQFNITKDEDLMLRSLIQLLNSKQERIFPAIDTSRLEFDGPSDACYFCTFHSGEIKETFGTYEYPEISYLSQYMMMLNQKYITPMVKISLRIELVDVRERYNHYRSQNRNTGALVLDFDSIPKPPCPRRNR